MTKVDSNSVGMWFDKKFTYSCKCSDAPTCLPENINEPNEGRSVSNATSVPRRPASLLCDHNAYKNFDFTEYFSLKEEMGS